MISTTGAVLPSVGQYECRVLLVRDRPVDAGCAGCGRQRPGFRCGRPLTAREPIRCSSACGGGSGARLADASTRP
ncbi:hypothetical protein ACFPRL_13575 [Pseudoclavibacter helvolus]